MKVAGWAVFLAGAVALVVSTYLVQLVPSTNPPPPDVPQNYVQLAGFAAVALGAFLFTRRAPKSAA